MERRHEIRLDTHEPVVVTELGANRHPPIGGMILDLSGCGMSVKLPHCLRTDALVRVEASNMLLLGEVLRCEPESHGFRVALVIRHSLQNLQALQNLNRALLDSERVETPDPEPVEVDIPVAAGKPIIRE